MTFKYWVEFDEDGEIKALYKSKDECVSSCKEYIVKLIPIVRNNYELTKKIDKATKSAKHIVKGMREMDSEIQKTIKDLRRFSI
jgi:hypothetical protein